MRNFIMLFALFFVVQTINAQDATTAQSEITDEELEKYAVTMDSVEDMKTSLLEDITKMVESNGITNARYNDLSKIVDDEAALKEAKATPEEIAFLKEVAAKKEEGTKKIQETFQTMAKEFVGASSYNKIKDQLKTNPELKKRYETQLDKLGGEDSEVN